MNSIGIALLIRIHKNREGNLLKFTIYILWGNKFVEISMRICVGKITEPIAFPFLNLPPKLCPYARRRLVVKRRLGIPWVIRHIRITKKLLKWTYLCCIAKRSYRSIARNNSKRHISRTHKLLFRWTSVQTKKLKFLRNVCNLVTPSSILSATSIAYPCHMKCFIHSTCLNVMPLSIYSKELFLTCSISSFSSINDADRWSTPADW